MSEDRRRRGLLDTSVVVAMPNVDGARLPAEMAVSTITMAELTAGPHAADDLHERARRQDQLQRAERTFDPIPFDVEAAQAYGLIYAAVTARGRKARGRRAVDLLIAATVLANDVALFTCNPTDFDGLGSLIDIVPVDAE